MSIPRIVGSIALLVTCHGAWPASFDCQKTQTSVEKLVCADESVSTLDSRLGRAYALALHDAYSNQRPALISEQKAWIRSSRDQCIDTQCLSAAYISRLRVLSEIKTEKAAAEYVTDEKVLSSQTSDFESSLHQAGLAGNLSCTLMVRLIVEQGGRDQSYGAICNLGARRLMLCDDTMVGKLTVSFAPNERAAAVADFTANNCPPGG